MKISLRWLCDHLAVEWRSIDVDTLVALFNTKVAEIEQVEQVSLDCSGWSLSSAGMIVHTETQRPVTYRDVHVDKEGNLPPVRTIGDAHQLTTEWEADDVILEIDNKSITHRPDMWGHRGFAREIAALLDLPFKDKTEFLADLPVQYQQNGTAHAGSFTLQNDDPTRCSTLAGVHMPQLAMQPTDLRMLSRFVKIGYRARNATVDLTNYVMADWGQPMHAYDADRLSGNLLLVRRAREGEQLALLDDSVCELTAEDTIVADSEKTLGLAGIMGGRDDSIGDATTNVLLEAACWHASSTRRSAARHKVRTESSQRFEKTLDPAMTVEALQRFVFLAKQLNISHTTKGTVWATGDETTAPTITLTHQRIEDDLGIEISVDTVRSILHKLTFGIDVVVKGNETTYTITVPTFRASKDITEAHDIVEEIARSYGFARITPTLPLLQKEPTDFEPTHRIRRIKEYLAYGAGMHEQRNYAFYDEPVLAQLAWTHRSDISLLNPVSAEATSLVSSLVPHLCKNIMENSADHDNLSFFEFNRVWGDEPESERYELACLWYAKRGGQSFFALKEHMMKVCDIAHVSPMWEKVTGANDMWDPAEAAQLRCGDTIVGHFGKLNPLLVQRMGGLPETTEYAGVLDGSFLRDNPTPAYRAHELSKYQASSFDVSALMPRTATVGACEKQIADCSPLITNVRLIDFFERKEWTDKRSLAFRMELGSMDRTLAKEEIEAVRQQVIAILTGLGGELRG